MISNTFTTEDPRTVSVVVPAYNEEHTILACLRALVKQTARAFEIIVVDNRSTDRTAELVRGFQLDHPAANIILLTQDAVAGLIPTRNVGLDAARGTVLARIDADTIVDADWIANIRAAMTDAGTAAVTGPVRYYDLPMSTWAAELDHLSRSFLLSSSGKTNFLFGSNMALRSSAWATIRNVSCADADDQFHEDIDLAIHLNEAGLAIRYESTVRVGISARRLTDTPSDFADYTRRFDRTCAAHDHRDWRLLLAGALLRLGHPFLRRLYAHSATAPARAVLAPVQPRQLVTA